MKRLIQSGLMVASLSLMLSVPAYADTPREVVDRTEARINSTINKSVGTLKDTITPNRTGTIHGMRTDGGTGTTRGYTNGVWDGGIPRGNPTNDMINGNNRYGTNNVTGYGTTNTGNYRTRATTNNGNWGWLGLLGLIGLAGMRSRNPQGNR
jgi:hypothetical protein